MRQKPVGPAALILLGGLAGGGCGTNETLDPLPLTDGGAGGAATCGGADAALAAFAPELDGYLLVSEDEPWSLNAAVTAGLWPSSRRPHPPSPSP
jgi:hypothetical protein